MRWPWEKREQGTVTTYTDRVVGEIERQAVGGSSDPSTLAAVETCVGLWARAMASAEVDPINELTRSVTAEVLHLTGRELARTGNALFLIDLVGSLVELRPVASYDVRGGISPSTWVYRVDLPSPSNWQTRLVTAGEVLHFRINAAISEPWRGRGPLSLAQSTGRLACSVETALRLEQGFAPGRVAQTDAEGDEISKYAKELSGGGYVVQGAADPAEAVSGQEHKIQPLGPSPEETQITLRSETARSILSVYGVPPSLYESAGDGSGQREGFRRLWSSTLLPCARLIADEISSKLDTPGSSLTLSELAASDAQGRGRALASRATVVKNLVAVGIEPERALKLAGFDD